MTDSAPQRVPLDALHRRLGARMGAFAGWDMPIQYPAGLKAEHLHTRAQAGLFDVSHMGQLRVRPRDGNPDTLRRELEAALPVDLAAWPVGVQRYSVLLNDAGGIEDDLMLINLGDEVRIVANAGNREHDRALLQARCPGLVFDWIDAALLALQGPAAEAVLRVHKKLSLMGYGLMLFDGYRPWSVTKLFWEITPEDKRMFVANPKNGSKHNRGCAVDLTIYDLKTGRPLPMPSDYDEFTERASPDYEGGSEEERRNRNLLRALMEEEGFIVNANEWWHFDFKDWERYDIYDIPFDEI